MDCGHGSFTNLQRQLDPGELTAVVITHEHPDHCVDIYGLHVLLRYAIERSGVPGVRAGRAPTSVSAPWPHWGDTFDWHAIEDGAHASVGSIDLAFSRTDHPPPTYAVEASGADGRRLVYTSDTGPGLERRRVRTRRRAGAVGGELRGGGPALADPPLGQEAGAAAREARAQRLVLTHLWPRVDRAVVRAEGSEAFGDAVTLAAVDLTLPV